MKVVVLLSGGLDSVTALHEALAEHGVVASLSFDYGAKHHARELPMAAWQSEKAGIPHVTLRLPFVAEEFRSDLLVSGGAIPDGHYEEESMKSTVVPFRNGIMLSIAAGFAESRGAEAIVIAAHSGDHAIYPDCREEFLNPMADAIRAGTYARIELLRPFVSIDKAGIVRRGAALGVDFSHTWSCYKGGEIHCGSCGTCVERREAFLLAGVPDPTVYLETGPLPPKPLDESSR
ncbi:MAG: 7-cyano-7-deazaguanine synthase QueC [Verrucomicrobia bacterium]|nr:MAG: 7-cyano-7-deazaguanine synthase QueC [Verrucomicrobiota bacterium]